MTALHFQIWPPLTYYSAVVPTTLPSYPYPPVVKRQPSPADGDGEANNRSNPMPGSAMWPPIGITMQYASHLHDDYFDILILHWS